MRREERTRREGEEEAVAERGKIRAGREKEKERERRWRAAHNGLILTFL